MKTDQELLEKIRTLVPLIQKRGFAHPNYHQALRKIYEELDDTERERFIFLIQAFIQTFTFQ